MTKQEFQSRVHKDFTDSDFEVINTVYMYHPSIDYAEGKDKIALIFDTFGMRVIKDMLPTAKKAKKLTDKMSELRRELDEVSDEYGELSK